MLKTAYCPLISGSLLTLPMFAQDNNYKIVFSSREYKRIGRSQPRWWSMILRDGTRAKHSEGECTSQEVKGEPLPSNVRLPEKSDHWNFLTSVSPSPDGKLQLVGSEAGSSTSYFEDYWFLDRSSQNWQYVGSGNEAKWSPDSSKCHQISLRSCEVG
jgi:hypothetical protein